MTIIAKVIAGSLLLSQGVTALRMPATKLSTTVASVAVDRRALLAGGAASFGAALLGESFLPATNHRVLSADDFYAEPLRRFYAESQHTYLHA